MTRLVKGIVRSLASPPVVTSVCIMAALAAWTCSRFGTLAKGMAYARGERIFVDERIKSVPDVQVGREHRVAFALTNLADIPITVIGAKSSCGCTGIDGLPLKISGAETRQLVIKIKGSIPSNTREIGLRLYTDAPDAPEVEIGVIARMASARKPDATR